MTEPRALDILLHDRKIGTLAALDGDRSIFTFADTYVADPDRATLSLSFRDTLGGLITDARVHATRLHPFLSNLLPEGSLRDYLARRAGVKLVREYPLLAILGTDLPGAVRAVLPADARQALRTEIDEIDEVEEATPRFRFSLAGVQLKFSALKNKGKTGGLTVPLGGEGGDWIVKLPSTSFADVPENEFATMTLAAQVGIEVPDFDLVALETIGGLPEGMDQLGATAFVIRRFDRSAQGAVHIEDFAQVFRVYPDDKYDIASYRNILTVLGQATDQESVDQFIRRLTFSVLIGNGDMHLKNWSLIYPDQRTPVLSPAYDLLSTIAYIPGEQAALKFRRSKEWGEFSYETLGIMADKARVATTPVIAAARETVERFDAAWAAQKAHLPLSAKLVAAIEAHRRSLAI